MLQLMLHAHRRIAIPPETRFVISAYTSRNSFGDLREEANRRALATWIVSRRETLFYDLGLNEQEIIAEIVSGPPTLGSALGAVFRGYAARFGKPRWGDKRPGYYDYIPALRRLFPRAQFVHLIRDGRDCVASLKGMPWFRQDVYGAICTWIEAIDAGKRAARRLPADCYTELRYEDLVADPAGRLTALCEFLEEDFDPAMTEPDKVAAIAVPSRKTWHAENRRMVTAGRSGTWRDRLEPWEASLCEAVMAGRLGSLGYDLTGGARIPPGQLARYARTAALRRAAARKRAAVDRLERLREPGPVECRL
jgi:hypothetical protein